MNKQDIIDYVMTTPHNTNKAVLNMMLNQLENGGSSSDFSTAEVTISTIDVPYEDWKMPIAVCYDYVDEGESVLSVFIIEAGSSDFFTIPLYKGKCQIDIYDERDFSVVTIGNATYHDYTITITGDCTITIS